VDKHVIAVTRRMSQQLTVDEHWKQVQITHMTNTQHQSISAMQRLERQLEVLALTPSQRTDDDLKILEDLLLGVKFAAALPLAKQHEICRAILYQAANSNTVLFRQGDFGDEFYIIISGSCFVSIEDQRTGVSTVVATLYAGDCFGELALLQDDEAGQKRQATITCREFSEFVKLKKGDYDNILRDYSERDFREKIKFLEMVPELKQLDYSALQSLAYVLIERDHEHGSIIARQGEEMDEIYFVAHGSCKVIREVPNFLGTTRCNRLIEELGEPDDGSYSGAGQSLRLTKLQGLGIEKPKNRRRAPKAGEGEGGGGASPGRRRLSSTLASSSGVSGSLSSAAPKKKKNQRFIDNRMLWATPEEKTAPSLFLEVGMLRKHDTFGECAVIRRSRQESTVVTTSSCRFYTLNKWDFMRRIDRLTMDALQAKLDSMRSDEDLQMDYLRARQWDEYKKSLVKDILVEKRKGFRVSSNARK